MYQVSKYRGENAVTINQPVRELLANVSQPFERARAMPRKSILARSSSRASSTRFFPAIGSASGGRAPSQSPATISHMNWPASPSWCFATTTDELRAMSNVCRHRMSTMLEGAGNRRAIVCPYHGWSYNLDGSLRAAPAMDLNRGFCKEDYRAAANPLRGMARLGDGDAQSRTLRPCRSGSPRSRN